MLRKFSLGAAAVAAAGAVIALGAPNAAAAQADEPIFAGVYPSQYAAAAACSDGYRQGQWSSCAVCPDTAGQSDIWIGTTDERLLLSQLPEDCIGVLSEPLIIPG